MSREELSGTPALCHGPDKKKIHKEFARNGLEALAELADTMESMEYWEVGVEERVFLLKFLCDEALSSNVFRNHLSLDPAHSENKLKKLYKELENKGKADRAHENEEGEDNGPINDSGNNLAVLRDKVASLESKMAKVDVRGEFFGRDSVGRLYWVLGSPKKVVASGPHSRREVCVTSESSLEEFDASERSSWTCYESDAEIEALVGWLRDDDTIERELKETIIRWQRNKANVPNDHDGQTNVQVNHLRSSVHGTKARAALEKKFGSFLEEGAIHVLKKKGGEGRIVNEGKVYHCDCLEVVGSARRHCFSCHSTFISDEVHHDGKCELLKECDGSLKPREAGNALVRLPTLTNDQNKPNSPFVFEEIRANFCTESSLKEVIKDVGLIGSNGTPSFACEDPPQDNNAAFLVKQVVDSNGGSTDVHSSEKQATNESPSDVDGMNPEGITGKTHLSSLGNTSAMLICQSSLAPLVGRVYEILLCLKVTLLDIEAALPREAFRSSRGDSDRLRAWRAFVKSAQSIHEMVQATIILEDMIRTEYLRKEWWYWSSPSAAAKISTVSSLALRIYALDAAIFFEKPPLPTVDPTEPVAPADPKSKKQASRKSNTKRNPRSSSSRMVATSNALEPTETSRFKNRSKMKKTKVSGDQEVGLLDASL